MSSDREVMGDGGSALTTARTGLRRSRPVILGVIVLAVILLVNLLSGPEEDSRPLSPGNAAPPGARAVAEVLAAEGVDVERVDSYDDALASLEAGPATLFLHDPQQYLSSSQVEELIVLADRAVLAAPGERQLAGLGDDFAPVGAVPLELAGDAPTVAAGCTDGDATAAGTLTAGGTAYSGAVECFPVTVEDGGGDAAGDATGGLYTTNSDGSVAVLGAPSILSNAAVTDAGNAALALRALGSSPTLVWYEPTGADVVATGEGIDPRTLLPPWVDPLLLWLLACAVLAMLWRGRRMGPLATEPLPVVVRAAETAEGRARLYQDSRAVGHAAATLRAACLARMARRLRVDRGASAAEVIDAAARHSGRPRTDLEQRLLHLPTTNHELVLWAQDILDLEKEITPS
ncbi:hypothetical protein C4K88_02735 [Arthrobacter pityocampae]|uniref:DUF4350 domain-containing protein n=1 Tax=Arthrobacter pityocampae TaxID=547334 RepID=A0A2S5J1V4_9MICC|nr:DUF4350 domain-containing protein [Arthrobacter pityocampae]PPB50806.1 hypothetical protein C4K88_02735 [Arthrobacter pityocampae]